MSGISKIGVGVLGCGNISGIYFKNLAKLESVELIACTDLDLERAQSMVDEGKAPKALSVDEFFADEKIEIVLNITPPAGHFPLAMRALEAGKHVYGEKPFSIEREEGLQLIAEANKRGLRLGSAPDTFLGAAQQTAADLVRNGAIGKPVSASAFMMNHGHESWHPSPEFYYKQGGGPLFDMGPYYLTTLLNMLGPIGRVTAFSGKGQKTRICTTEARMGEVIEVETPTHIAGACEFVSGAILTMVMSFDVWGHNLPCIEVHGTEGSLSIPDPNTFGGTIKIKKGAGDWEEVEISRPYAENSRGLGVADMARSIMEDRPHRATGDLAMHVLDTMTGLLESGEASKAIDLKTTFELPQLMQKELGAGEV